MSAKIPDLAANGWYKVADVQTHSFKCGFCDRDVASNKGWDLRQNRDGSGNQVGMLRICPRCCGPNFFVDRFRSPRPSLGRTVDHLPEEISQLYEEARTCTSMNADTAAVLACRKLLMHIAVAQGADEGLKFIEYVNFLADAGFVPPNGRGWVDHIRARGNEANHEIVLMGPEQSGELLTFLEMLLRFIYEFPAKVARPPDEASPS